jgi:oligoendopeptidase F
MSEEKQGVVWDLTPFFPEFDGKEMQAFKEQFTTDIGELCRRAREAGVLTAENGDTWEEILVLSEDLGVRAGHIMSYLGCLESADATNDQYPQARAGMMSVLAEYGKFDVDLTHAIKDTPADIFEAFLAREKLTGMTYALRRTRISGEHTMSRAEEKLATDLSIDGLHAWGRLYDRISGKIEFDLELPDGTVEKKPISQWRALMGDADRAVGRAAFIGGNKAWAGVEDICAAALNAIAGNRLTLNRYRGYEDFLEQPLFSAATSRETLDAMYEAIHANAEIARDIFRAKAKALGQDAIWMFEREAPLPATSDEKISWEKGTAMVKRAFSEVYPNLAGYFQDFLDNGWMESEVRPGKRPGAFCTGSHLIGEQRVYMTFNGTLSDVKTMAHEIGHAFHSHILKEQRPTARHYPMTLAETASIFGEHILAEGVYGDSSVSDEQKKLMLDTDLCGAANLILDITVRFEFEKKFHEERMKGEVSVARLKELMTTTQQEVFGDVLVPGSEDPYFWASKLHFYITGVSFYNFPYTFGFLLARALYHMMKKEGPSFLPKYEEFLRMTGSATVEEVAMATLGADMTKPEFWTESIRSLSEPLELYRKLTS